MKTLNFMIDFETLGSDQTSCKVLSVAYTHFVLDTKNPKVEDINKILDRTKTYYFDINLQPNYTTDKNTMSWWKKQDPNVVKAAFSGTGSLNSVEKFCEEFSTYVAETCNDHKDYEVFIWSRGTNFDITILERLFKDSGEPYPFPFWKSRDSRTFIGSYNLLVNDNFNPSLINNKVNAHDPRYDVAFEIIQLQEVVSGFCKIVEKLSF